MPALRCALLTVLPLVGACGGQTAMSARPIALDAVPISFGNSHARQDDFPVTPAQWAEIDARFSRPPPATPADERAAIAWYIARMERLSGDLLPTRGDLPRNEGSTVPGGAMDCLDESTNTTTYLMLAQQRGLLRFHRVLRPAVRFLRVVAAHNTAVVEELPAGQRWAVDSWYGRNGEQPIVETLEDWYAGAEEQSGTPAPAPPR